MKHCNDFGAVKIEVGFMTVISAYIDLFIQGEMSGGGNCPNTDVCIGCLLHHADSTQEMFTATRTLIYQRFIKPTFSASGSLSSLILTVI